MSDSPVRTYIARTLSKALSAGRGDLWNVTASLGFLCDHRKVLALDLPPELVKAFDGNRRKTAKLHRAVGQHLERVITLLAEIDPTPCDAPGDVLARNITWIGVDLGLTGLDREILELIGRYIQMVRVESLVDALTPNYRMVPRALAFLLARPRDEMQKRLRPDAPLVASGLLRVYGGRRYLASVDECDQEHLDLANVIRRSLLLSFETPDELKAAIFGQAQRSRLGFDQFTALGANRDLAARVLRGAVERRAAGVNILLHGPPGSGKTEFARALADHLALDLFAVGEDQRDGYDLDWRDRLTDLRFMGQLAGRRGDTLLLFDEMEDIRLDAKRKDNRGVSKITFNRMLETNPVPVIWTSNHIWDVDPAYLRRMTLIVEFKLPTSGERRRIWRSLVAKSALADEPETLDLFAERYEVTPALAANAVKAAELAGGNLDEVDLALRGVHGALTGGRLPPRGRGSGEGFDLKLINADCDLERLIARLTSSGEAPAVSLCLYGPPGTGKSEFAQYLARAIGLKPLKKRGSDLFSMWVGETEKKIAQAFDQALRERAVLIFDEGDALLSHRNGASQSWEISQVAEMLTWMEVHPLPFCCTTNLIDRLDQAALRRFLFKVKFDYLERTQVARAFERFFGRAAPAEALALSALTPSDFTVVRKKAELLGLLDDGRALVDLLAAESRAKPGRPLPIGFATA